MEVVELEGDSSTGPKKSRFSRDEPPLASVSRGEGGREKKEESATEWKKYRDKKKKKREQQSEKDKDRHREMTYTCMLLVRKKNQVLTLTTNSQEYIKSPKTFS